jgi:hypothetical protein
MNFWGQREFRPECGVRPPDKMSIRGLCEQLREKWQSGKQTFPGWDKQSNENVGRVRQVFRTESTISRASAEKDRP